MLNIFLAGLVIQKVITVDEAEMVSRILRPQPVPETIADIVDLLEKVIAEVKSGKEQSVNSDNQTT